MDNYERGDYSLRVHSKAEGELKKLIFGVNSLGNALEDSATEIVMSLKEKSENFQFFGKKSRKIIVFAKFSPKNNVFGFAARPGDWFCSYIKRRRRKF